MKSTIYHQTFHAIEHNANVRLKNYHLEENQSELTLKQDKDGLEEGPKDRISLFELYQLFNKDRPNIFYFLVETLTLH
jgi:hypothetical protein